MPSVMCTLSGLVVDDQGPVAGAAIRISHAVVAGSRSTTYETGTTSDSSGAFSFTVPQGSRVRFASSHVSAINSFDMNVPNNTTFNLGNFRADRVSEPAGQDASLLGSIPSAVKDYVSVVAYGNQAARQLVFTFTNIPVTLVKNATSTGGGGTKFYTFPQGLILPKVGSSNLTVANALDKSFLAAVGTTEQGTGGSLATTTSNILPSTAATTSSGVGTCKMKSTVSIPVPGTPMDGTSSAINLWLNACLNADATGAEALTFSGTITVNIEHGGDN